MHKYTIVTAMFDIRQKENNSLKDISCNGEFMIFDEYLEPASFLFNKEYPLIIFCEPKDAEKLWELRPKELHNITRIIPLDYEELPFYCHFDKFQQGHMNRPVLNLHKEKFTALYKFIVNMKTEFVRYAINMNPFNSEFFGWMDMRLHCVYDISNSVLDGVLENMDPNRVIITQSTYTIPEEIQVGRSQFYDWTRGKVCAGFFIGKKTPMLDFCEKCKTEFLLSIGENLAPSDEMIYAYIVGGNHHLFEPHVGDYSDVLRNLDYHRNSTHLACAFIHKSFEQANHYYTHKVCESMRLGYLKGIIKEIRDHDVYCIWYYNYVACFWMGKYGRCRELLEEYYGILSGSQDLQNHLKSIYGFFRQMMQYLGNVEIMIRYDNLLEYAMDK